MLQSFFPVKYEKTQKNKLDLQPSEFIVYLTMAVAPKHAINAFFINSHICALFVHAMWEKNENKQKRGPVWPIKKKQKTNLIT